MRCDCCDAELNDEEATAKFTESGNYVNMCSDCRRHLPKDIRITVRNDLKKQKDDDSSQQLDDPFDLGDMDDEAW